ncbi:hypothetical protein [Glycomyces buryatensis]|uniref:hypothetical protein n=1 Tax=Glycomyces buryatensis TaxID=2570927 RepID=UPI001FE8DC53|nr:hypothetical protein [Glycomyces buryatensis]
MRTLRLVTVASVGLLALAACGSQQGAAMFVGDERVSEATVDGYVEQVAEFREEQGEDLTMFDYSSDREQAAVFTLYTELGRQLELEAPGSPADADELDALIAEASSYYETLLAQAEPRALTEAEVEAVITSAQSNTELANLTQEQAEQLAGFSDDMNEYVEEYDIAVNPRYGHVDLSPIPGVFEVEIPQR